MIHSEFSAGESSIARAVKWRTLLLAMVIIASASIASAQTPGPAIFFTDVDSGPNSGGESVSGFSGAYVNIYGNYFGTTQGSSTVTWNGLNCLRVVSWGAPWLWYQKIVVQLGSSCTMGAGNFVVTVGGVASTTATVNNFKGGTLTPSAFTVRSGNIYCVSSGGNDGATGKFPSSCWATIQHAIQTISSGDIAYIETITNPSDGCAQYSANLCVLSAGASGNPKAIVVYPGATVTINTSQANALRTPQVSGPGPYWTIAGFNLTSTASGGLGFSGWDDHFRIVANIFACPNGTGTAACVEMDADGNDGYYLYGNQVTQAGTCPSCSKTYHGFYFAGGDNHSDIGWNDIHNVQGGRGLQVYSEGVDQYDFHIHDNLFHDTTMDGINLNGVNPNSGPIAIYNNVMYNVGKGPDPPDGAGIYSCVNLEANGSPTTPAQVYNNTCYNVGSSTTADTTQSGTFSLYIPTQLVNNIAYETSAANHNYFTSDAGTSHISTGSVNNDFFGNGSAPTGGGLASSLNVDPLVVSVSALNFQLQSASPMINAGLTIANLGLDHNGVTRAQGAGYDIGAYEFFAGGSAVQLPNPPTNLAVTVQ